MEFIKKYLDDYATGIIVNTYNKGKETFNVFGYAEVIPNKIKLNENMDFDIASLTKFFIATLVHKTIETGKMKLDDTIFNIDNRFINLKDVTVLQLLSHHIQIYVDKDIREICSKEELDNLIYTAYVKSTDAIYDNNHYVILTFLLEKVWNKKIEELLNEIITEPLNLKSVKLSSKNAASCNYFKSKDEYITNITRGTVHDPKARKAFEYHIFLGHAGLFINTEDLMKFLKSFIDKKEIILKNNTISAMMKNTGEKSEIKKNITTAD